MGDKDRGTETGMDTGTGWRIGTWDGDRDSGYRYKMGDSDKGWKQGQGYRDIEDW
jgi:hypothetical protein